MILALSHGNGTQVIINCDGIVETMEELTAIIKGVKEHIKENENEDFADYAIAYVGRMAFSESDEERKQYTDDFCKWLEGEDKVGD